jgi:hydroxyacyl-ACP dehydratase HTD2-like protein with hotdog domain
LSRSSAPLFHEPFTLDQTTARIDRIAAVRERELRSNLYRSWGLK